MRAFWVMIVTVLAVFAAPASAEGPGALGAGPHLAIRLVAETARPKAGSEVTLALDTRPQKDWHGYWSNPGDAGFPAKLDWTLPQGVTAGAPVYPVPGTLLIAGLMNYVYETPYAPLVTLKVPAGLAVGTKLPVRLKMDYLVCTSTVCVPERAELATDLVVGDGSVAPDVRAEFDAWRRAIPRPLDAKATLQVENGKATIAVPYPAGAPLADAYFFPLTTGVIDYAAPQTVTREGDRLVISTKATNGGVPIEGVLRIGKDQALAVSAVPGTVAAGDAPASEGWLLGALIAFAGAVLGGLILNVMPCVFPILSLKALSLARGHLDEGAARREALAYAAGVIAVCLALGGLILGLRAGGSAVGWAFQLQDPRVVVLLLLLTVAIALNLAGLFEIPTPRFVNQAGGVGGAFATGALAAFIATPCTGPFMGAALGAALVLPWAAALAVFAGLGLGLALPFLALGFVPSMRRLLPKPGAWMETFRHVLSVPMWLTALALAWVLGRQAGVDGLTLGLGAALAVALVLWVSGRRQARGLGFGIIGAIVLVAVGVASAALVHPAPAQAAQATGAEAFSEKKLADLRAQGRPVFAYFTADWCLTCKVNEAAAIDTDATRAAFARNNVAVLVGDWTDGDATLGRFIEQHNRAGVPLYLYYAPGAKAPQVLPQILTPGILAGLAS
ncbi:thiol:disulfide interchange protein [Sphingomonas sp. Leaf357]|uniref:protein-disulfide reductase DsbD family protein n=1 Tax=Sphingomonas sp. Leaf357 TaxID=1736350 RepID=UPI0006FF8189|nr:protein-disulfide reductase DsbD domain-containing protein [Sphingomonas sp. Leaf357]KQS01364.1 thiol:disulfide interchange protein [Sphingomonas sp. Leaf357]